MAAFIEQFSLGLCFDENNKAVCIALTADSVTVPETSLMSATSFNVDSNNLIIECSDLSVVLIGVSRALIEAATLGLPMVIIGSDGSELLVSKICK